MKSALWISAIRRLLCALWLGILSTLFLPASAWAQNSAQCAAQIQSVQVAKAESQGRPPALETLEWTTVHLPDQWKTRWPHYAGSAWYRLDLNLPCPDASVALTLTSIIMAGEVYINQDLLWRDTHLSEPLSRSWNMPRYWLLPTSSLRASNNQIWIRVHGSSDDSAGLGRVNVGEQQPMFDLFEQAWWSYRSVILINITVSAVICVLFSFAWLQNRSYKVFGWYALNSMFWALFLATALKTSAWPFSSSVNLSRANGLIYAGFVISFCIFALRLGELRLPRLEKLLWAIVIASSLCILLVPEQWFYLTTVLAALFTAINVAVCLWFPWHAWRSRKMEQMVFGACIPIVMLFAVHDFLTLHGFVRPTMALIPYSIPLTMVALALVLGRNLSLNMRRIEQFNVELTDSITRACDDLSTTLEREHSLALRHTLLQERMQISHDLHDSLGGSLVRSIAYVEQSHQPLPNTQVLSMLKLMRDDLRQMIDNGTSASLQVPETPAQWAAPMRHRFGLLFEELNLQATWSLPTHWLTPPSAIQCLALTRVLEEALTNVIKHSRASRVSITLELAKPQELCLRIEDNGTGFDVHTTQINSMGVGMRSMLARLERMQGTLQIQSSPGATVLEARMSLGEKTSWPSSAPAPLGSDAVSQ